MNALKKILSRYQGFCNQSQRNIRIICFCILCIVSLQNAFAQVGIGTTTPDASSVLDITATDKGVLIPRISLTGTDDTITIASPVNSLLIYNNASAGSGATAVIPGFYYWNTVSGAWVALTGAAIEKIDDLSDGKSDNDGSDNGSSIFLGIDAGVVDDGSNNQNVGIGFEALKANTSSLGNTAIGYQSLTSITTTGIWNTAIGNSTLLNNSTGVRNTATGYHALIANSTGDENTASGYISLGKNTTGGSNTAFGAQSLENMEEGYFNSGFGKSSLNSNTTGWNNSAIGIFALFKNQTGNDNTALGRSAGNENVTGSGNVFLGKDSGFNELSSNKLYIENSQANADNALIYGEFDNNILRTNSEFQIGNPTGTGYAFPTTDGTVNQLMLTDGSGQISFVDSNSVGTDDQNLTAATLTGTSLQIDIENGSSTTVDLSSLQTDDSDWFEEGTTNAPNSINDNVFTQGRVAIGTNTTNPGYNFTSSSIAGSTLVHIGSLINSDPIVKLSSTSNDNVEGFQATLSSSTNAAEKTTFYGNLSGLNHLSRVGYFKTSNNTIYGIRNDVTLSNYLFLGVANYIGGSITNPGSTRGIYNFITASSSGSIIGIENRNLGTGSGVKKGVFNFFGTNTNGIQYGTHTEILSTNNETKYGLHAYILDTGGGTHYGIYSDVQKSTGYAGYFLGRVSFGNTTSNRYLMPAADGTANQIMQTDGSGQVSFVDSSALGTDDQTIDTFSFNNATNELTLEIENDGIAPQTVDLSSLTTNTKALVRATLSTGQGIPTNIDTKVNFDSETYDLNSNYDTTTNRFTATEPGYYKINSTITTPYNSFFFEFMIYVNGNVINRYYPNINNNTLLQSLSIHDVIFLNTNDYIEIYINIFGASSISSTTSSDGAILSYLIIEQIR